MQADLLRYTVYVDYTVNADFIIKNVELKQTTGPLAESGEAQLNVYVKCLCTSLCRVSTCNQY